MPKGQGIMLKVAPSMLPERAPRAKAFSKTILVADIFINTTAINEFKPRVKRRGFRFLKPKGKVGETQEHLCERDNLLRSLKAFNF